ncbi:hypothetical protein ACOMHN_055388 [Nucella lapillus]
MSTVSPVSRLLGTELKQLRADLYRESTACWTAEALSALYTPHSTPLHQPAANRATDMKCVFVLLLLVSVMAVTSAASDTAETDMSAHGRVLHVQKREGPSYGYFGLEENTNTQGRLK